MSHPSETAMTAADPAAVHDNALEQLAQFASRTSSQTWPPEVDVVMQGIAARLSWPSMHWGTEDVHPDAWPHIAAAALDTARTHDAEAKRLLELVHHLRQYGECAPGGHETWAQLDTDLEHHLRGLRRPDPLEHVCRRGEIPKAPMGACHPFDEACADGKPACRNHGGAVTRPTAVEHADFDSFCDAEYDDTLIVRDAAGDVWLAFQTDNADWLAVRPRHEDDQHQAPDADWRPIGPAEVEGLAFPIRCASQLDVLDAASIGRSGS